MIEHMEEHYYHYHGVSVPARGTDCVVDFDALIINRGASTLTRFLRWLFPDTAPVHSRYLHRTPVIPGSVIFTVSRTDPNYREHGGLEIVDDGFGNLIRDGSGRINYSSGKYEVLPDPKWPHGTYVCVSYAFETHDSFGWLR